MTVISNCNRIRNKTKRREIVCLVRSLSQDFTKIIPITVLKNYPCIYWGGNGLGNRWARQMFNYTVIYSTKKTKLISENLNDRISPKILKEFFNSFDTKNKSTDKGAIGIIGIFPHSIRKHNTDKRPINKQICETIRKRTCVVCGSNSEIVCDHKNDLYNDKRVLNTETQSLNDFQPLCNHCNLQKREISKKEHTYKRLYSAKNIPAYKAFPFEFPWEKKAYDERDPKCKCDTYWYDPVEFNAKIFKYMHTTYPIINEIKSLKPLNPEI